MVICCTKGRRGRERGGGGGDDEEGRTKQRSTGMLCPTRTCVFDQIDHSYLKASRRTFSRSVSSKETTRETSEDKHDFLKDVQRVEARRRAHSAPFHSINACGMDIEDEFFLGNILCLSFFYNCSQVLIVVDNLQGIILLTNRRVRMPPHHPHSPHTGK